MLKPIEGAPTPAAPRFAAAMTPGPPPVAMTLSRMRPPARIAPPSREASAAARRVFADAGRAEHHDGGSHAPGGQRLLHLGELQHEADPALRGVEQEVLI